MLVVTVKLNTNEYKAKVKEMIKANLISPSRVKIEEMVRNTLHN